MKHWARPILSVVVFLLLGAIVNVAVAWGFAIACGSAQQVRSRYPSSPPEFHIAWSELREEDRALLSSEGWPASIDHECAIHVDIASRRQFGLRLIAHLPYAEYNLLKDRMREDYRTLYRYELVSRPGFSWVVHVEAGWPLNSLRETQFHRFAAPPLPRMVDHVSAFRPPELFGVFPPADGIALPLRAL